VTHTHAGPAKPPPKKKRKHDKLLPLFSNSPSPPPPRAAAAAALQPTRAGAGSGAGAGPSRLAAGPSQQAAHPSPPAALAVTAAGDDGGDDDEFDDYRHLPYNLSPTPPPALPQRGRRRQSPSPPAAIRPSVPFRSAPPQQLLLGAHGRAALPAAAASPQSLRLLLDLGDAQSIYAGWHKPEQLPSELPHSSELREQEHALPAGSLHGKQYGHSIRGRAGPYNTELLMLKAVATAPGVNTERAAMRMQQPVTHDSFRRGIQDRALRWLSFSACLNPDCLLTLHSYIAHAADFFLYLTFCLQRNGGKFEEVCKQVLVSAGSGMLGAGCAAS